MMLEVRNLFEMIASLFCDRIWLPRGNMVLCLQSQYDKLDGAGCTAIRYAAGIISKFIDFRGFESHRFLKEL